MSKKSTVRLHGEAALLAVGIDPSNCVFVDKSKSGHRAKFSFVYGSDEQIERMHQCISALNPGKKVRVWNHVVPGGHSLYRGYDGLCVKIYN